MRKLLLTGLLLLILKTQAYADNVLMIRLEEPKSPTNDQDFPITFVVLDTQGGRNIHVICEEQYEGEGFNQFYATDLLGGNTGTCQINSGIVDKKGNYTVRVTATAGSNNSTAATSFYYTNESPETPRDYSKNKIGECTYEIKFKTADDNGRTNKVEVYRSTETSFKADNGSRVAEISIGSNTEKTITNDVPDCKKTYYYAVRAFGNAGNGSGIVGDKEIKIIETETTDTSVTTTANAQAIPVGRGSILGISGGGSDTGKILGVEEASGSGATPAGELLTDGDGAASETGGIKWGTVAVLSAIGAVLIWGWRRLNR